MPASRQNALLRRSRNTFSNRCTPRWGYCSLPPKSLAKRAFVFCKVATKSGDLFQRIHCVCLFNYCGWVSFLHLWESKGLQKAGNVPFRSGMGGVAVGARSVGVVRVGVGTRSANRPPSLGDGGSGVEGGGGASLHLSGCHMGSRARRNGRVHRVQSSWGGC